MHRRLCVSLFCFVCLSLNQPARADAATDSARPVEQPQKHDSPEHKRIEQLLLSMDMEQSSTLALWWPNYQIMATPAKRLEKNPQAAGYVRIKIENLDHDGTGKPIAKELLSDWPEAEHSTFQPLVGWVVKGKIVKVSWFNDYKFPIAGSSTLGTDFPLLASEMEGHPLVFFWNEGRFVPISQKQSAGEAAKAFRACVADDVSTLEKVLNSGLPIATKDGAGLSLAYYAAQAGSVHCLEFLKAHGADLKTSPEKLATPLGIASRNGRTAAVDFLLSCKIPNEGRSQSDQSPLYQAASQGHLGTVRLLLDKDASPGEITNYNETAFSGAINADYPEIAELLYKATWSSHLGSNDNDRAFLTLCRDGRTAMVRFFLDKGAHASFTTDERSALSEAALKGSAELAEILVKAGAKVNWSDERGVTPLILACTHQNVPFVQVLLASGAKPNLQSKSGLTALHAAVLMKNHGLVALLLKAGGSPEIKDKQGLTPLDLCLVLGNVACVEELTKAGAKLDIHSPRFPKDLESVVRMDHANLLRSLIQEGIPLTYSFPGQWPLGRVADIFNANACTTLLKELDVKTDETIPCPIVKASALQPGFKLVQAVKPIDPRPLDKDFPKAAVKVRFLVDQDGSTRFISVDDCPDPMLRVSIIDTLKVWKFTPPLSEGKPVAVRVTQHLEFPSAKQRKAALPVADVPPKVLKQVPPIYPFSARRQGAMATVVLNFTVNEQGNVENVRAVKSSGQEFVEPAVDAVKQWKFKPATAKGVPVPFEMQVPIIFSIEG